MRNVRIASVLVGSVRRQDLIREIDDLLDRGVEVNGTTTRIRKLKAADSMYYVYDLDSDDGSRMRITWDQPYAGRIVTVHGSKPDIVFIVISCLDLLGGDLEVLDEIARLPNTLNSVKGWPFVIFLFMDSDGIGQDRRTEILDRFGFHDRDGPGNVGYRFFGDGSYRSVADCMLRLCIGDCRGSPPGTIGFKRSMRRLHKDRRIGRRSRFPIQVLITDAADALTASGNRPETIAKR